MIRAFRYLTLLIVPLLLACQKEDVESAVDTRPFPMDQNKDHTVAPGDDFFQYCNGIWLDSHPVGSETVGGMYDGSAPMNERVEALKAEDPELGAFFALMDQMYDHPEESTAWLQAQIDAIPKPASQEEAFRALGNSLKEGCENILCYEPFYKAGKVYGYIRIASGANLPSGNYAADLVLASETASGRSGVLSYILEGLGVQPDQVYVSETLPGILEQLRNQSLDQLYDVIKQTWQSYEAYITPPSTPLYPRALMSYRLSYDLAKKYVPESVKLHFREIVINVRDSFRERLLKLDWMSETTRGNALEKLDEMKLFVGYPDAWYTDYMPPVQDCKTFVEAAHRLSKANIQLMIKLLGSDDAFTCRLFRVSYMGGTSFLSHDLSLVNATYDYIENDIVIYPAFMLPPIWKEDVTEAWQYALTAVIGHEITHGFDSSGANYDEFGNKRNWWTVADKMAFEDEKAKLVRCYSSLEMDPYRHPGIYENGTRTLSENIADLGGFLTALDAYQKYLKENGYSGESFRQQLRKFYESWADIWCVQYSEEKFQNLVEADMHSHARLRVNGVAMNTDLWYDLYKVDRNNLLYLPEAARTYIW